MIKLKLTNEQLFCLCSFTWPAMYEARANHNIQKQNFFYLDFLFNLMQVGEKASKLYLFGNKKTYSISLNYYEAASLMTHTAMLQREIRGGYNIYVAELIKTALHQQLTNYKTRFYGSHQTKKFTIGRD